MSVIPQTLLCSLKQPPGVQLCFLESQGLAKPLDFLQSKPVNVGKAVMLFIVDKPLVSNGKYTDYIYINRVEPL